MPAYFPGVSAACGVELGRYVLAERLAGNAESWALARMHALLRRALPDVRAVIAYCDPVERRDETGAIVKRGHIGTIYKATNATYRGRSSARTLWLSPSGASLSDRLLSKVRLSESGERYALDRLAGLGAPRRQPHELGADYIGRLKECGWLHPVRHPGNLAFAWSL